MSGATAAEFNKWEAHAKTVDDDALSYIISDCRQAQNAMRGWNPERENYYADQGMTYAMERLRREGKLRRR
jgi:hypothetical protein